MKRSIAILIVALFAALLAAPAIAQESGKDRLAELIRTAGQDPANEAFRREYAAFYAELMEFSRATLPELPAQALTPEARAGIERQMAEGLRLIEGMTPEELALLRWACSQYPDWRNAVKRLDEVYTPEMRRYLRALRVRLATNAAQQNCPGPPGGMTAVQIARTVSGTAEGVMQLIPEDAFTAVAYVVAAGVWGVANVLTIGAENLLELEEDCKMERFQTGVNTALTEVKTKLDAVQAAATRLQQSADALTAGLTRVENQANFIAGQVDVKVSTRATQTSVNTVQATANIINAKTDQALAKLDALAAALADFRAENLRLQLELNLLLGPRYNHLQFLLPRAQGGHLELVREIVADTISRSRAAGAPFSGGVITQAEQALTTGDTFFTARSFKDAYASWRTAYLLLSVVTGNKQP